MTTQYYLKLEQFEGPLDLLLHLIRVNEIDIFHIDIFKLTQQYLAYLRILRYDDLADAGEFIEMAATLIEIKTKMLLPGQESQDESGLLSEDDPRYNLQERLLQYETFKKAAEYLSVKPQFGVQIRSSMEWQRLTPLYEAIEAPLVGDPASLVVLYEQMLRDLAERKPAARHEAKMHQVTVEEKIIELGRIIDNVNFALFQGFYKTFQSRYELVVYILASLELAKAGTIKVHQEELNGPLWLYRSDLDAKQLPLQVKGMERPRLAEPPEMDGV
ncbi:segregation and condensation protein A [Oligoflexus tunisiensis]|uniref:segregation and condensation protein A n=1 Tax=Oligoflexus tunisiensis TaxID=708132 RepID=UPI000B108AA8|nr:segregation/condensation protein A [Oligoflexus tunisiensis]